MVFTIPITLIFSAICIFCIIRRKKLLRQIEEDFSRNPHFEKPNDDGKNISAISYKGFGTGFMGKFRKATIGGYETYVVYHCTLLLFVIFPRRAYRVIPSNEKWGINSFSEIIGSDITDSREKKCIFLNFYSLWSGIIAFLGLYLSLIFSANG